MDKKTYKKFLEDRVTYILSTLERLKFRLENDSITYPEFLYIESNLYNDLIVAQRELVELDRKAVL